MATAPSGWKRGIKTHTYYLIYWNTRNWDKYANIDILNHLGIFAHLRHPYETNWNELTFISSEIMRKPAVFWWIELFKYVSLWKAILETTPYWNIPNRDRLASATEHTVCTSAIKSNRLFHFIAYFFSLADLSNYWKCSKNITCRQFDVIPWEKVAHA